MNGLVRFVGTRIREKIATGIDTSSFVLSTDVQCAGCKSHLGLVFEDGSRAGGSLVLYKQIGPEICGKGVSQCR